ncbi:MAG TPA: penicillin-binding transpeptidase domain-containing protein [Acidimicrobiia bacterium]|nr:penicillin-binding transpeptidase domain-containing protein [Acidimicrobiia bacterium]
MNRQVRRVGIAVVVCFLALFVQLNWLQVIDAHSLANNPRNVRAVLRDYAEPRGQILTSDGVVVARSEPVDDEFERLRTYPTGPLFAHVSGFFSFTLGASAAEDAYNRDLSGRNLDRQLHNLGDWLIGKEPTGDAVLSLSNVAQEAARDALGDRKGSVVVLDPATGEVVALWSYPSYDPAPLAAHSSKTVQQAFDGYTHDPSNPMLARAYRERYAPGSTFKVVTASTAIETGTATPQSRYPVLRFLALPQSDKQLHNFGNSSCGGTLADSFRQSCNTTFGQVGLDLGEKLVDGMKAFGITDDVPFDLPAARSGGPAAGTFAHNKPSFANAAIGQGDIAVTPLQMATVAGAIANGGVLMAPHVVREIRDADGRVVRRIGPDEWKRAVSPATAAAVTQMMIDVVKRGTGTAAAVPGYTVAGKTGTAEAPGGPPHAWFIGFAPAEAPRFAIAVIVERGGDLGDEATGGRVAAPVAGKVLAKLLATPRSAAPSAPGGPDSSITSTTGHPAGGR